MQAVIQSLMFGCPPDSYRQGESSWRVSGRRVHIEDISVETEGLTKCGRQHAYVVRGSSNKMFCWRILLIPALQVCKAVLRCFNSFSKHFCCMGLFPFGWHGCKKLESGLIDMSQKILCSASSPQPMLVLLIRSSWQYSSSPNA